VLDFYEGIVVNYLRADKRSMFMNTEYCISLDWNRTLAKRHWYCDILAVNVHVMTVFLCEVSIASPPRLLMRRLRNWYKHWDLIPAAIAENSGFTKDIHLWQFRPWIFVPQDHVSYVQSCLKEMLESVAKFAPMITTLEMVQPWKFPQSRGSEDVDEKQLANISEQYW
jgi:hypothetical protein